MYFGSGDREPTVFQRLRKALVARAKHQFGHRVVVFKRDWGVLLSVRDRTGKPTLEKGVEFSWGEVTKLYAWGSPEAKREEFVDALLNEVGVTEEARQRLNCLWLETQS